MASITNYSTLVQAVQDTTEDDGTEFVSFIPTAIDLAEEKLFKELDLPELEETIQGALTASNSTLTKPTNYEFCEYFIVTDSLGRKIPLRKKKESFVQDYWPDTTVVGTPKYYTDASTTTFKIAPTPAAAYNYNIKYTQKPTKLSVSQPTNYFINNIKDVLFFATMIEISIFMKAWSQIQVWEERYRIAQEAWNVQAMRYRRDGEVTPNKPDSTGNTLRHTITTNS